MLSLFERPRAPGRRGWIAGAGAEMRAATRDLAEALSRLAGVLAKLGASSTSSSLAIPSRGCCSGSSRALFHASAPLQAEEARISPKKERSEMLKELVRTSGGESFTKVFPLSSLCFFPLLSSLLFDQFTSARPRPSLPLLPLPLSLSCFLFRSPSRPKKKKARARLPPRVARARDDPAAGRGDPGRVPRRQRPQAGRRRRHPPVFDAPPAGGGERRDRGAQGRARARADEDGALLPVILQLLLLPLLLPLLLLSSP